MPHDHRKSDRKDHVPKAHTSKANGSSKSSGQVPCRFLFNVTELHYSANAAPVVDDLQNQLPPLYPQEHGGKLPGYIFRYDNGSISPAHGYSLSPVRPEYDSEASEPWRPSTIGYYTDRMLDDENHVVQLSESRWLPFQSYSTVTMYNCGPRASTSGNVRTVAGRNATWVGSLVPEAYNNIRTHTTSLGLGGEFSLLIGLMALAQPIGRCDEAFTDPQWSRNRWTGRRNPAGWPRDTDPRVEWWLRWLARRLSLTNVGLLEAR
ncbi:uncharacterized protein PG998_007097 [Apiospora kogelbergensis]|uniref:uncharacterized protein n=1 Tax=Apiospora kogelbergensis TaxID=1337665 RepID=UPI00312EB2C9